MQNAISSVTKKGLAVLLLTLMCFIPTLFVMGVVSDRESRSAEARAEVSRSWGSPQSLLGPVLAIPFSKTETVDGKTTLVDRLLYVFPATEDLSVNLSPSERVRGIFRVPVYTAAVSGSARFEIPTQAELAQKGSAFRLDRATLAFPVTDVRSIDPKSAVSLDGAAVPLEQGSGVPFDASTPASASTIEPYFVSKTSAQGTGQGVHASVDLTGKRGFDIAFTLGVSGNESISFVPAGTVTQAKATSVSGTPSFTGAYLPERSEVGAKGFSAEWSVSGLGRAFPSIATSEVFQESDLARSLVTVALYDGVDQYAQVTRAVKYAILFIALTFMAFFFVEVLGRLRVHPVQYVLVGAALALFYLLLLSLSEQVRFGAAYLVAAVLTTGLIAFYSAAVLKTKRHAGIIAGLLSALYAYLYLVLRSEDYALLSGTLLLFGILATTMFLTRRVDWYGIDASSSK